MHVSSSQGMVRGLTYKHPRTKLFVHPDHVKKETEGACVGMSSLSVTFSLPFGRLSLFLLLSLSPRSHLRNNCSWIPTKRRKRLRAVVWVCAYSLSLSLDIEGACGYVYVREIALSLSLSPSSRCFAHCDVVCARETNERKIESSLPLSLRFSVRVCAGKAYVDETQEGKLERVDLDIVFCLAHALSLSQLVSLWMYVYRQGVRRGSEGWKG